MDAIANWLWQGCLVAVASAMMLRLLERARAHARCLSCWAALLAVLVLPLAPLVQGAAAPVHGFADPAGPQGSLVSVPGVWWTSGWAVIALWAVWSSVHGARFAGALRAIRRARKHCRPLPSDLEARLHHWTRVRGTGRRTRLVACEEARAAAVLGCGSPVIGIAPALVRHLTADELDRIVIHEWAHVQRRDDLTNVLQLAARAIAGWHPAVWWIDRRLQVEREVASDEMAVAATGSARCYAACLVKLAALPAASFKTLPALGALSSPALAERVLRLLSPKPPASPAWSRSAAVASIVALVALSLNVSAVRLVGAAVDSPRALLSQRDTGRPAAQAQPDRPKERETPVSVVAVVQSGTASQPDHRVRRQLSKSRRPSGDLTSHPVATVHDRSASRADIFAAMDSVAVAPPPPVPSAAPAPAPDAGDPTERTEAAASRPPGLPPPFPVSAQPLAADTRSTSPWDAVTNAGVATGQGSKRAGLATAGFFSRLGKRIAGSF
ncbi:MAG TPA: M56 family metallopeptidase [Vicinamibacterales bacterium]|nr:M56 family metallopeptidase [Vicinamibacterales bacterium]